MVRDRAASEATVSRFGFGIDVKLPHNLCARVGKDEETCRVMSVVQEVYASADSFVIMMHHNRHFDAIIV